MTMVRNEGTMLERWAAHYGSAVGRQNLIVIDDQSDDGSTADLECTVLRMPYRATTRGERVFGAYKSSVASKFAGALLEMYDVVIFVDVDEFLVPDPRAYSSLLDYLSRNDADVLAPIGMNVVHVRDWEPPLRPGEPLLAQRRHVKVVPGMCKPGIKRVPARWTGGTHGIHAPYTIQRDLFLFHAKYVDFDAAMATHERRHSEYQSTNAGRSATWRLDNVKMRRMLRRWTSAPDQRPSVIDFDTVDLEGFVREDRPGVFRSFGSQSAAMDDGRLYRLPDFLSAQV